MDKLKGMWKDVKAGVKKGAQKIPTNMGSNLPKVPLGPSKPMKFPYTFSAKLVQFPWKFYIQNCWGYKYYFIAIFVSLPFFNVLHKLSNSDASRHKWDAIQLKDQLEHAEAHGH